MNILVTGGLGYLGGRLARHLIAAGHRVDISSRRQNIRPPSWLNGALLHLDLRSDFSLGNYDVIFHCAAMNEIECAKDPEQAVHDNIISTLRLVLNAKNTQRFFYLSTAHVYGAPLLGHITENLRTLPTHPYAYTHRAAEDIVLAQVGKQYASAVIIRLSNAFGYPESRTVDRWTLVVNDLCLQIAQSRTLHLKSDGTQLRDFIPMGDFVAACAHFLNLPNSEIGDGIFNVGSGQTKSIFEMAELVRSVANDDMRLSIPPVTRLAPAVRNDKLSFDIAKLKQTGFEASSSWREEIAKTIQLCMETNHA